MIRTRTLKELRQARAHVATLVIAGLTAIAFATFLVAKATSPHDAYEVRAVVPSAVSLGPGASVRIAGLKVGRVTSVEQRGGTAVLGLAIDDENGPLPADSRVGVRLRTLVGETYVQLYPGRAAENLPEGAVLPPQQANQYVEADEVLDTLRGRTRTRARRFLQGLGRGVAGRGRELNAFLGGAAGTLEGGSHLTRVLHGQREQISRLVENLGDVSRAIGEEGDTVRQLARGARVTFRSVADRRQALRALLRELPPTLREVRTASGTLQTVSGRVAPVLAETAQLVDDLAPVVRRLRPAADQGRRVVRALGQASPGLERTMNAVTRLAGPFSAASPVFRKVMCELNPLVNYLKPHGPELARVFAHMGSSANHYDASGHSARLIALAGEGALPVYPQAASDMVSMLTEAGFLAELHHNGYNPYPLPGKPGPLGPGEGINGPEEAKRKGVKYHRVEAEC